MEIAGMCLPLKPQKEKNNQPHKIRHSFFFDYQPGFGVQDSRKI
jgi:hypothetical protein